MANYNFEKLDSKEFERLANALCAKFISCGTNIFGSGTDGGREATYRGKMNYPTDTAPWDGYLVVQCKQREKLGRTLGGDTTWALTQLNKEMKMYEDAVEEREKPEYFLFITNVELSAKRNSGGKDKFLKRLEEWREKLGIKEAHLWDRDKLGNLLDSSQEITKRFGQLLPGDLVHAAANFYLAQAEAYLAQREDVKTALSMFLQRELIEDQYVNIKQAGYAGDEQPPLARVFVDLRANPSAVGHRSLGLYAATAVQLASDCSLAPTKRKAIELAADNHDKNRHLKYEFIQEGGDSPIGIIESTEENLSIIWNDPSRFVFVGGPGQGKSTLVQYLAQRHRAALLSTDLFKNLDIATNIALTSITEEAEAAGSGLPKHARLPFRIILEQLANELYKGTVLSVLDYVALTIKLRSGLDFSRKDAERLLQEMPWLVIFDGLDEVPAVSNRKEVLTIIRSFLTEARIKDADLLVIATTRPQGYNDEFDPSQYNHLTLDKLTKKEALNYAKKLVSAKYPTRPLRQNEVLAKLEEAINEKVIARLMGSPLQVTIMAVLVETVERLPGERYTLFQYYYDIIYRREQGRARDLAPVLARFQQGIKTLHDRIALQLQIAGENEEASDSSRQSRISRAGLEGLIRNYLTKDGHEGEELEHFTKAFMAIALERLVFIMPLEEDSYGFEVRSLQEFAAARALTRNGYLLVKERLLAIAPIPYWLNTTLFAVGSAFTQDDDYCDMVVQLCGKLNNNEYDPLLCKTLSGSRLALSILEESIGEERPVYKNQFLDYALQLLNLPDTEAALQLANLYEARHEQRFKTAAQVAISVSGEKIPISLLTMLAVLSDEVGWADKMLKSLWPTDAGDERALMEEIANITEWEGWKLDKAIEIAASNSVSWVMDSMDGININWLAEYQEATNDGDNIVGLKLRREDDASKTNFLFYYPDAPFKKSFFSKLKKLDSIHVSWSIYLLCEDFILNRSAKNFANALTAVAHSGLFIAGLELQYELPWQLFITLRDARSSEELLLVADKARKGLLGDSQAWKVAEARWKSDGCIPSDFDRFLDDKWPFTAEIAEYGIQPLNAASFRDFDTTEQDDSVKALIEVFLNYRGRSRGELAKEIYFLVKYGGEGGLKISLPLKTIATVVQESSSSFDAISVVKLFDPEIDLLEDISTLNEIGLNISSWQLYYRNISHDPEKVVATLLAILLNGKQVKEGVLRLLAGIIQITPRSLEKAKLEINHESLSPKGKIALLGLNLLASDSNLNSQIASDSFASLLQSKEAIVANEAYSLLVSLNNRQLSNYTIGVLIALLDYDSIAIHSKQQIIASLARQPRYRRSGFSEAANKKRLSIPV